MRNGTGWSFDVYDNDKSSVIRSAYCPICHVKTVEIRGLYEPVFTSPVPGLERLQGCVTSEMLCCSEQCRYIYMMQLWSVNSKVVNEITTTRLAELGALDDVVARSIQGQL